MRVLSGIQPSGALHLGNYFAMMKRMIDYQENHELFCFVVNYHALTSVKDADLLRQNTFEACVDFLALGIDPEKSHFYVPPAPGRHCSPCRPGSGPVYQGGSVTGISTGCF